MTPPPPAASLLTYDIRPLQLLAAARRHRVPHAWSTAAASPWWARDPPSFTTAFRLTAAVPYPDIPPLWQPKEKWFDLSTGSMLVLYRSSAVSIVDLHSKTMEKVMDCFLPLFKDQMNRTAVPYEMGLVDFFMLQLGGPRSTGSSG